MMPRTSAIHSTTGSPSSRRAWIEILVIAAVFAAISVALLTEGVDRNLIIEDAGGQMLTVALLTEGVDRNISALSLSYCSILSPSSRRAWIEIRR